tara:strand:+ start:55 stop:324 length:270 start_codon:yes stop_codon:yes gene_type:complete
MYNLFQTSDYQELFLMEKYDFTGLKCPLPVLKAKRVLKNLAKEKKVVFISDDPASPIDFTHFSENEGYEISIKSTTKGVHHFTMYKLEI